MHFRIFYGLAAAFLIAVSCAKRPHVSETKITHQLLANEKPDSAVAASLASYKTQHDAQMTEVIGYCEEPLIKDQPEGNLGNFVSDCVMARGKEFFKGKQEVHAVLLNNGGLRVPLPRGELTKGKIFELMPFDNELVLVELSGKKFYEMLCFIAEKGGMPAAGIRMEITQKKKPAAIKINGAALDTNAVYHVITSDYLAEGGDNMTFFKEAPNKKYTKLLLRDVLLDYCRAMKKEDKTILVKTDGRISLSK